jgi:CpeT protein
VTNNTDAANQQLLKFARILAGHYSNKKQAMDNPRDFAHINIYFRPLNWIIFNGPGFYSEQSYNHDPWRPYRQGIHKLEQKDGYFKLLNFGTARPERIAGAGFQADLLADLNQDQFSSRTGCAMHFYQTAADKYRGEVEPGNSCLIPRDGKLTYLVSEVEVDSVSWISRDQGLDPETNKVCWGSEHGYLSFERVDNLNHLINTDWLAALSQAQ